MRRTENEKGRYTLVYLAAPGRRRRRPSGRARRSIELTYNWDEHEYAGGRNFGHLAFAVDDIYDDLRRLKAAA